MNVKLLIIFEVTSPEGRRGDPSSPSGGDGRTGFGTQLATRVLVLAGKLAAWSGLSDWL